MDLKGILAISGHGGLFKLVSQARNGIIVESLETKKRMPAYATSKISALEDIAIFTDDEDVHLKDVFKNIFNKENGGETISHKSKPDLMKKYFAEILPDYDRDRVYVSDMKRVFNWYNILHKHEMLTFEEETKEEAENTEKQETQPEKTKTEEENK